MENKIKQLENEVERLEIVMQKLFQSNTQYHKYFLRNHVSLFKKEADHVKQLQDSNKMVALLESRLAILIQTLEEAEQTKCNLQQAMLIKMLP